MANPVKQINQYPAAISIDGAADYLLIDPGGTGTYNKINRNVLLGITSTPIGASDAQSLSNKTLGITNIVTLRGDRFILQDVSDATKQAVFSMGNITTGTTRTYTLPNGTVTLADTSTSQTLTNKTLTSPTITGGTIDNAAITVDSISGHTTAANVTVGGVALNNGVVSTANSVTATAIAAGGVQPQALVAGTGTGWTWQSWSPTYANLTIGNGTVSASYTQIGKTVFFYWTFVMGNTSVVGTSPTISFPVTTASKYQSNDKLGTGASKSGATDSFLSAAWVTTTTFCPVAWGAASTYVGGLATLTATVPGTWSGAAADYIRLSGFYEAA
jgi:hypothetical protein